MTATAFTHRLSGIIMACALPLCLWGNPVSESEAFKSAKAFLESRGNNVASDALRPTSTVRHSKVSGRTMQGEEIVRAEESCYYVFNVGNDNGFVIVSGDDRTPEILGYADSGHLYKDDMPDGLQYLLDGYAEQIEWMNAQGFYNDYATCESRRTQAVARTAIDPLIQTRWNQGAPYNNLCPEIDGEKTVTGCVATCLAQLMNYHKWPQGATTAIPGYTVTTKDKQENDYTLTVPERDAIVFDWNAMTNTYAANATGSAADAVATLMQYCGSALQMIYGLKANDGSSSYSENIPYALKAYFGYDGGVRHAYRSTYTYVEWVDLIYSELAEGRPVALGGQATGGGHSFVCDGYQGDDYFHINWGWGGSSDGYYRLSVLQPWEQGIGGSSTLDGFSFSQDAVIGIQPPVSGNKDYCLSLEGLRLGSPDANNTSKTFTRSNGEFSGISLYFLVYSYYQGSNAFDFAVQLVNGSNEVVKTLYNETKTISWNGYNTEANNTNKGRTITGISIPSTVVDGTYYIKVVSRPNGTTEWQECFDGARYQMTVVISGNELTITVPRPATVLPTAATITVTGDTETLGYLTQGYEQEVTATITGGAIDYHDNVVLRVDGTAVMGKVLDIPAGQTVDAHFSFIPTKSGNNKLTLYNAKSGGTQIGSETTVNIKESDATDNLDLSFNYTIDNLSSDGILFGNALRATITVGNSSTTNTYVGKMSCSLRKWTSTTTDNGDGSYSISTSWTSTDLKTYPLIVGKNSSTPMTIAFDGLETTDENTRYSVRITYQNSSIEGKVVDGVHLGLDQNNLGSFEVINGYTLGDATGATTVYAPSTSVNATDACFVDLRTLGSLSGVTVTPSTNPNCLYLLADGVDTPSNLTAKNVVKGTMAENIALTDGNAFYTPIDFTATNISYTRTFTRAATTTGGWNTLYLPFDVSSVSASGNTIDWFHSDSDTGKDFWLKTMTGDDNGTVYFNHANSLKANTPYIIALPGKDFGEKQLTEKAITFSGSNASIKATTTGSLNGNSYKFCGSTVGQTLSDVYLLNNNGNKFIKGEVTLPAFRAWIEPVSISSLSRSTLIIGESYIQGIDEMQMTNDDIQVSEGWYTLDGRRIMHSQSSTLKKGIYIHNGKKLIIR